MAPGKRVIKRIENATSRHVTFAKRRRGLMKKAQELSVLCDASVALLVFSPTGKLFEYSSSDLHMIIQRYLTQMESPSYSDLDDMNNETDDGEVVQLKRLSRQIERSIRQMNGKDLEGSSLDDLAQIERNIKKGLKSVKSWKEKLMFKQLEDGEQKLAIAINNHEMLYQELAIAKNNNEMLHQGLEYMEEVKKQRSLRLECEEDAKKLRSVFNPTKEEEEDVSSEDIHDAKQCGICNEELQACLCLRLKVHL